MVFAADAKKHFSRRNCPAYAIGLNLLKGSTIRQEYLEAAIRWVNDGDINSYISDHQWAATAIALWNRFRSVIYRLGQRKIHQLSQANERR